MRCNWRMEACAHVNTTPRRRVRLGTWRSDGCKIPDKEVAPIPRTNQLTVSCKNRPGTLARVARVLGVAKVNILGFLTTTSGAEGSVHLVVDNVRKKASAVFAVSDLDRAARVR